MELPRTLGKYELVQLLGEGGMASVYRASMSGPGGFRKQVALKLLKPEVSEIEQMVELLFNEARLGGLLQHNNLVETYEFDQIDGRYYMAIEFVDGYTLSEVMARVPVGQGLPPRIVAKLAVQICQGLAYAHAAVDDAGSPMNLVHRDLKPANVMIRRDGVVKIADFGIAKAATNLSQTQTGLTRGTPVYMSPEQAVGAVDRPIDRRSDLFSLASVLCEAVTGELVFGADQMLQVLNKVASADVRHALGRVDELAPPLAPILGKAWEHDRNNRFGDAVEMGREIRAVFEELPGPSPHLASWLAAWMGEPEPSTLDQEIDPLTSGEVAATAPMTAQPRTPTPTPLPTVPSEEPVEEPPRDVPLRSVNRPLINPDKVAARPITHDEPRPDPAPSPPGVQPGRLSETSRPHEVSRRGFRVEHGLLLFAFVGLLFAVVYLSMNDWEIPGLGDDGPPALLDPDGEEGEAAEPASPAAATRHTTVEAVAPEPATPPPPSPVDLGLSETIDGKLKQRFCIKKYRRKNETFEPVTVRYTVLADGSVDSAALATPDQVDPDLGDCLISGMEKLKFHGKDIDGPTPQTYVFRASE